jgi:hypothetical protein
VPSGTIVGVFGGSVARGTALNSGKVLERTIAESCPNCQRPIKVLNFAVSGYKQPQQLFLLTELSLLNVPIDVVINIDGFNEVALGLTDASRGWHPLYPNKDFLLQALSLGTGNVTDEQLIQGGIAIQERRRANHLREWLVSRPLLRHSEIARMVIGGMVQRCLKRATLAEQLLRESVSPNIESAVFQLPDPHLGTEGASLNLVIDLWSRTSRMMRDVAWGMNAQYFHVLQPNQYLDGSKTLTPDERASAWAPERPWSRAAAFAYPHLRTAGAQLVRTNIDFFDMTQIFFNQSSTIYGDPCCHFNEQGYNILAATIGRSVGSALERNEK